MSSVLLKQLLFCLVYMHNSAAIGISNRLHTFTSAKGTPIIANRFTREQPCRWTVGQCIPENAKCPTGLRHETSPGQPWCEGTSRCCYKGCNEDCKTWCYPSTDWSLTCPSFCNGLKQSPIDICTKAEKLSSGTLTFSQSYRAPIDRIKIENNGHTVTASWDSNLPSRTIYGGGLPGEYTLAQFHFHWGCENNRGSEHTVDGRRYAMELHLVHYKTQYGSLQEALKYSDGLAVLGVFFNVGEENTDLKPITKSLSQITAAGAVEEIDFGVSLINLIPTPSQFSRYKGSLTTPTCNEVVYWSVFSEPLSFSQEQVATLRSLKDKDKIKLCDNYRGIQPLNGRVVTRFGS